MTAAVGSLVRDEKERLTKKRFAEEMDIDEELLD
jgi:hypothetical protein